MENAEPYQQLLDEESIGGIAERREAIRRAIDGLLNQLEQNRAQRQEIDDRDESLYESLMKLDAAHARISRGKRYTEQVKKRAVRRFWSDTTHEWIERYLFEWAVRQLEDGPKEPWSFSQSQDMSFSVEDVIRVMSCHPETFKQQKGAKPRRKYARTSIDWALVMPMYHSSPRVSRHRGVESAIFNRESKRTQTLSEMMHDMLEDAIRLFYAGQYDSVIQAFSSLYWKGMSDAYSYFLNRTKALEDEAKILRQPPAPPPSPSS